VIYSQIRNNDITVMFPTILENFIQFQQKEYHFVDSTQLVQINYDEIEVSE
jgi:hypothetical protein